MNEVLNRTKSFGLVVVSLGVIFALLLGSVIPAKAEPEKVVKIGVSTPLTGPTASSTAPASYGVIDYLHYASDEGYLGDGVRISTMWEDTRGSISKAITATKRFIAAGALAVIDTASSTTEAITPLCQRAEIPIVHEGGMTSLMITKPEKWVFPAISSWAEAVAPFLKWVKDNWTEERNPRVGIITYDYSSGWESINGMEKYGAKLGLDYVGREVVPLAVVDTSVEWLRMVTKKPDWVYLYGAGMMMTVAVKDAYRLEIQDKGIRLCNGYLMDETIIAAAGAAACEGWYIIVGYPYPIEKEVPGMKDVFAATKRYRGWSEDRVPGSYILGWLQAQILVEGVRIAIENVGYENLTGRAIRDGLASMKDFDGGILPPVTMTEKRPYWLSQMRIYKVHNGSFELFTGWFKAPFLPEI